MDIENVNLSELGNEVAANMPGKTVSQENVTAKAPEVKAPSANANAFANVKDSSGNAFNPDLHKLDEKGKPKLNRKGNFVLKGRGRKEWGQAEATQAPTHNVHDPVSAPASKIATGENEKPAEGEEQEEGEHLTKSGPIIDTYTTQAYVAFHTTTAVISSVLSDEWMPDNKDEENSVITPLAMYLREKQIKEFTPGQMLCLALVAYAGKRVQKPTTKERLTLFFVKAKTWFNKNK